MIKRAAVILQKMIPWLGKAMGKMIEDIEPYDVLKYALHA